MEIVEYKHKYRGSKVTFNSRKGAGSVVEGIIVQTHLDRDIVIIRDSNNFSHAVSTLTLERI